MQHFSRLTETFSHDIFRNLLALLKQASLVATKAYKNTTHETKRFMQQNGNNTYKFCRINSIIHNKYSESNILLICM
jgi:hypothetical protein